MAKKKAKKQQSPRSDQHIVTNVKSHANSDQPVVADATDELFDLSDPDEFRRAFIASEILNLKY